MKPETKNPLEHFDFKTMKQFLGFLAESGATPWYVILPVAASFIIAGLEGAGTALLYPLAKGAFQLDFGFIKTTPVIKQFFAALPPKFSDSNTTIFAMIAGCLFVVVLAKSISKYGLQLLTSFQSRRLQTNIKKRIFSRYMSFGKLFYDRTSFPHLMTVMQTDTAALIGLIGTLTGFLEGFLVLAVYLVILFRISLGMTLCALLLVPLLDVSSRWLIVKIRAASIVQMNYRFRLQRQLYNVLTCIPLIKSYKNEDREMATFARRVDDVEQLNFSMARKQALIQPIQEIIIMAAILIIAVVMFISANLGKTDVASFIVFFYILRRATGQFGIFNSFQSALARVVGPLSTVAEVLDDKDKFFIPEGDRPFPGLQRGIEVKRLTFSYGRGEAALKDLTLSIEKEKMTAVVGATGSGKTTFISLLMRFYDCLPGSIFLDGTDIRDFSLKTLLRHIALVSQDTLLLADTLRNNIVYGVGEKISDEQLFEILKKAQLYDFIARLPEGLNTPIGERGVMLSGGERQRVAIARALVKGSEILIMDEATSSLDSVTEHLIQQAMDAAIRGRTAIVVAHRLSTIKKADKILVLDRGELAEEGTLEELLEKRGKFYTYWTAQKFF